jgi:hypothetical protein
MTRKDSLNFFEYDYADTLMLDGVDYVFLTKLEEKEELKEENKKSYQNKIKKFDENNVKEKNTLRLLDPKLQTNLNIPYKRNKKETSIKGNSEKKIDEKSNLN